MKLSKYEADLKALIKLGGSLETALIMMIRGSSVFDKAFKDQILEEQPNLDEEELEVELRRKRKALREKTPDFKEGYQSWYSESLALIKVVAPDRYNDFVSQYKKPRANRKDITYENYVIEDAIQGLQITRSYNEEIIVDHTAALPRFRLQLAIVKGLRGRFESSLYDIEALVQADLLDNEVEAARLLHKNKFFRAAGAICGVVIEAHLSRVSATHGIKLRKKNLTIADFNEALKTKGIYGIPQWRKIQYLADIRNKCDHKKESEPSSQEVLDLIDGTDHLVKNVF